MKKIIRESQKLLANMYDDKNGLFSCRTRILNGKYVNDFSNESVIRYSINALVGIQRAVKYWPDLIDFRFLIETFLSNQKHKVRNYGDMGLLVELLSEADHDAAPYYMKRIRKILEHNSGVPKMDLQEISWISSGITAYAKKYQSDSEYGLAKKVFKLLNTHYLNRDTLLPFHSNQKHRRRFTAFGGIAYFLKALYEYSQAFSDKYVEKLFMELVLVVIEFQGPLGQWPWFYDVKCGRIVDYYQVYSVHQDSMAMLFLLPALDMKVEKARESILRSYRWLLGQNEMGVPMISKEPFFIYRSIQRKGRWERGTRIARSVAKTFTRKKADQEKASVLKVNRECRSYHLGWVLYVWSGRDDFSEFTDLQF